MSITDTLGQFRDKLLGRKGYKAIDGYGKVVSGCWECCHNLSTTARFLPPVHTCEVSLGPDCRPLVILDPYNVPEFCAKRIEDKKE